MLICEDFYIILVICSYNNLNNCVFNSTNPERPGDLKESFDVECLDGNLVSKYKIICPYSISKLSCI